MSKHRFGRIINGEPDLSHRERPHQEYEAATRPDTYPYRLVRGQMRPLKTRINEAPYRTDGELEPDEDGLYVGLIHGAIEYTRWGMRVLRPIKIIVY